METSLDNRTCYSLVTGKKTEGQLQYETQVGYAFKKESEPFYVLKMWMYPTINYFMAKARPDDNRYVVFTRKLVNEQDGSVKLLNPVGTARINDELKSHLEIFFRFPYSKLFMNLYPVGGVNV